MVLCAIAHALNLVLTDTTEVPISSGNLFSLMNDIAVFFRESYQRMNVWEQVGQDRQHKRLSIIGETRWWAKDVALKKIFGSFGKPEQCVYCILMSSGHWKFLKQSKRVLGCFDEV